MCFGFHLIFVWPWDLSHAIWAEMSCNLPPQIDQHVAYEPQNSMFRFQHMSLQRHLPFPIKSKLNSLQNPFPKDGLRLEVSDFDVNSHRGWFPTPKVYDFVEAVSS